MRPTSNAADGLELEKFPDAPPSIAVTAPEEVPDAGLRSLDHCKVSAISTVRCLSSSAGRRSFIANVGNACTRAVQNDIETLRKRISILL